MVHDVSGKPVEFLFGVGRACTSIDELKERGSLTPPLRRDCRSRTIDCGRGASLRFPLFAALLLAATFLIWVLAVAGAQARTGGERVLVTLFQSKAPLTSISILAPVLLSLPGSRAEQVIGSGRCLIECAPRGLTAWHLPGSSPRSRQEEPAGAPVGLSRRGARKLYSGGSLSIRAKEGGAITVVLPDGARRRYRGELAVARSTSETLEARNLVLMKDYVSSVAGSESLPATPVEALKAQSVLVQTLMRRYRPGDTLSDTTERQAYLGADYERPEVVAAVSATWGQTLVFAGRPVTVFYHSCCGGRTSDSGLFAGKGKRPPYDAAVECLWCKTSPFWKELTSVVPAATWNKALPGGVPEVVRRDGSGRPLSLRYAGGREESGYAFWLRVGQKLGWGKMPGTRFTVRSLPAGDVELRSNGAGHGVGMCQWGARGMAAGGRNYRDILRWYFPGTRLDPP